jgi:hypothetical protein
VQKSPNQGPGIEITYRGDAQVISLSDPVFCLPDARASRTRSLLRAMLLFRGHFVSAYRPQS